jgi:putative transposase
VPKLVENYGLSQKRACGLLGLEQSSWYYKSIKKRDDTVLREKITAICQKKVRYGRPRVIWYIRDVEKMSDNHKRIGRVYRELGLQVSKRPKGRRKRSGLRLVMQKPTGPGQVWAMDFVSDQMATGRRFRCLTMTDLYTHETPAIEVDVSLTGERVSRVLDRLKEERGLPKMIICDNGTEFTSKAMDQWALANQVELKFIQPGKPNQNSYCESFNSRLRDECLNTQWFNTLNEAKNFIETWRKEFNEERPHSSLKMKTPKRFADEYQACVA